MIPLLIICSVFLVGLIFYFRGSYKNHAYKITYNSGPKHSRDDYKESVADGVQFIATLVREYKKVVDREVHSKFKGEFQLHKQNSMGAKLVLSSFGESLIYIFPDSQNVVTVDYIDFPVQPALAYGFIDLNNPRHAVDLTKIEIKIPLSAAINAYRSEPGKIIIAENFGGANVFGGPGAVAFNDVRKMFFFDKEETIVGFGNTSRIAFKQSSPHYLSIYKHPGSHVFNLNGLLLISGKNTFDWSYQMAKNIGAETAEMEIKELLTKSEFFKLPLADKQLRPKAEEIIQKTERSEKDKSFKYPLWEMKKDIFELRSEAKQLGIEISYVDELLKELSLKPVDGTLFFYYPNAKGFMWQWSLMNFFFLILLALLTLIRHGDTPFLMLAMRAFSAIGTNFSIIALITLANGWVFSKKPESLTVSNWILPSLLYLLCIAYYLIIVNSARYSQGIHKV